MSIKVALLGFGGIARSHFRGYEKIMAENSDVKLVAICDINPVRFEIAQSINIDTGKAKFDLTGINLYNNVYDMLEKEEIDMVDICLPTYLHAEYTIEMLKAGKHVMCEKPMALSSEQCREMIETARAEGKKLMIGQCLRFEPMYLCLKEFVDTGVFGKVNYAFFDRISALPKWGYKDWFRSTRHSGGCALDLHIHDVDMVRFLFGEPDSVSSVAQNATVKWQLINSRFNYKDIPVVIATGSWSASPLSSFKMSYRVGFEKAEVILDGGKVTVYPMDNSINDGQSYVVDLPDKARMAEEIKYFISTFAYGKENVTNTPESALASVELVEKLRRSADEGGIII
ncbi:MAG: Gfo/Idh/MocA family oxidoreductase [Clostridia bacterium]|nr:Gfo/Idh/MocA family oxidoreductase [Clostridia bacterium]